MERLVYTHLTLLNCATRLPPVSGRAAVRNDACRRAFFRSRNFRIEFHARTQPNASGAGVRDDIRNVLWPTTTARARATSRCGVMSKRASGRANARALFVAAFIGETMFFALVLRFDAAADFSAYKRDDDDDNAGYTRYESRHASTRRRR